MSITHILDSHYSQNPSVDIRLPTELSSRATLTGKRLSSPTLSQSDRVTCRRLVPAHRQPGHRDGGAGWVVENKEALPGISYAEL